MVPGRSDNPLTQCVSLPGRQPSPRASHLAYVSTQPQTGRPDTRHRVDDLARRRRHRSRGRGPRNAHRPGVQQPAPLRFPSPLGVDQPRQLLARAVQQPDLRPPAAVRSRRPATPPRSRSCRCWRSCPRSRGRTSRREPRTPAQSRRRAHRCPTSALHTHHSHRRTRPNVSGTGKHPVPQQHEPHAACHSPGDDERIDVGESGGTGRVSVSATHAAVEVG